MLDYTQKKKRYFKTKLYDGNIVSIPMPKKKAFDILSSIDRKSDLSEVYEVSLLIINSGMIVSPVKKKCDYKIETLEEMFDFEDVMDFFTSYSNFMHNKLKDPN